MHGQQHIKIWNKSVKETRAMLQLVYCDAAVTMKTVYKWFERFRNDCESVGEAERSERPSTSKNPTEC